LRNSLDIESGFHFDHGRQEGSGYAVFLRCQADQTVDRLPFTSFLMGG
jgi:hypothetical protein